MLKNVSTALNKRPIVIVSPYLKSGLAEKNIFRKKVSTALNNRPRVILKPFLKSRKNWENILVEKSL